MNEKLTELCRQNLESRIIPVSIEMKLAQLFSDLLPRLWRENLLTGVGS